MSKFIIIDTADLVDPIRTNRHLDQFLNVDGLIRSSSVVLADIWRGVSSPVDRKIVEAIERIHPTPTPTEKNWLESGQILAKMREDHGFDPHKLRDLHFGVLIALTARSNGAH
jgi:hypothetical protein